MDISVMQRPPLTCAGLVHVGPYSSLGESFDRLGAWMGVHLEHLRGAPLAVYLDHPDHTPPDQLRTLVLVPVDAAVEVGDGPVERFEVAGGRYLVGVHRGGYEGLGAAWGELAEAVRAGGHAPDPSRPGYEVYVSDPSSTPVDELRTELCIAIA